MKLPRDMDAAELIKALERLVYHATRQSGSHIRLECADPTHAITIPNHRRFAWGHWPRSSPTSADVINWIGRPC